MNKKALLVASVACIAAILAIASIASLDVSDTSQAQPDSSPTVDVVMPNKSSRPGCEQTDSCYIPSTISVTSGDSVTWQNDDVAFHSVTSGSYDDPDDLFDSGHMGPDDLFTVAFDDAGVYDYFCTLHPWMKGVVTVASEMEVREGVEPP